MHEYAILPQKEMLMKRIFTTVALSLWVASGVIASSANVATIREGRVWEYVYSEGGGRPTLPAFNGETNSVMFRMWFDGTEMRDGVEYHRLVASETMEIWGYNYDRDTQEMIFQGLQTVPNCNQQVRLLREDNGKVYMYMDSSVNDSYEAGQHKDVQLYDFSKNVGESYETMYCLPYLGGGVFWYWQGYDAPASSMGIKSSEYLTIDGEECLSQTARITVDYGEDQYEEPDDYCMIEGIGLTGRGYLPFLMLDLRTASIYFNYKLNRVYNAEGEVIYRGEDIDTSTLSVGRVMNDAGSLSFSNGAVRAAVSGEVSLSLYDVKGSVVATTTASDRAEIATSMLSPGVYIAVCKTAGGTKTLRIII